MYYMQIDEYLIDFICINICKISKNFNLFFIFYVLKYHASICLW